LREEALQMLEEQSRQGHIDLFYGDESQVSPEGYVPYGWQFADEQVCMASSKGKGLNCFALISRSNQIHYRTSTDSITAEFVVSQLDELSLSIVKPTVVVLDNARVHTAEKIKERLTCWQQRGLFLFYLPAYSPHLNPAERLWKELKARWLRPQDYVTIDNLFYAVALALAAVGKDLFIKF
jgi:transposase